MDSIINEKKVYEIIINENETNNDDITKTSIQDKIMADMYTFKGDIGTFASLVKKSKLFIRNLSQDEWSLTSSRYKGRMEKMSHGQKILLHSGLKFFLEGTEAEIVE